MLNRILIVLAGILLMLGIDLLVIGPIIRKLYSKRFKDMDEYYSKLIKKMNGGR